MTEILIGLMIVFGLIGLQWTLESITSAVLLDLGLHLTVSGTLLGLALALYYHIRLLGGVKARGLPLEALVGKPSATSPPLSANPTTNTQRDLLGRAWTIRHRNSRRSFSRDCCLAVLSKVRNRAF